MRPPLHSNVSLCSCQNHEGSSDLVKDHNTVLDLKLPIAAPLTTLDEILNWESSSANAFNRAWFPLKDRICTSSSSNGDPRVQKLIVCHDMMGGYTDQDKYIQGAHTCSSFRLFHWHLIHTFIYFSHQLLTIPPVGYINAAHRHGVPVLGTFITEWDAGAALCKEMLSSKEKYTTVAKQMVMIAQYYGFDGWLINIENAIESNCISQLIDFVRLVRNEMDKTVPHSQVIWYDSVIESGELKWQDELNTLNMEFFNVADGIFLNYCWSIEKLQSSYTAAADRTGDVYVGIDVFGRGCPGGGGFNTLEALQMIAKANLSAALFAPGWVFECLDKEDFDKNQLQFWAKLEPYLPTYALRDSYLWSTMCDGAGVNPFLQGKCLGTGEWTNYSEQTLCWPLSAEDDNEIEVQICRNYAFSGGNSLSLSLSPGRLNGQLKLRETHIVFKDAIVLEYTTIESSTNIKLQFVLDIHNSLDGNTRTRISATNNDFFAEQDNTLHEIGEWAVHKIILDAREEDNSDRLWTITAVSIILETSTNEPINNPAPILLGDLKIYPRDMIHESASVTDISVVHLSTEAKADGAYISLTVAWRIDDSYEQRRPLYFDILIRPLCNQTTDNDWKLLGKAFNSSYRVSNIYVHSCVDGYIEIGVRPVMHLGDYGDVYKVTAPIAILQ